MTNRPRATIVAFLILIGSVAVATGEPVPLTDALAELETGRTVRVHLFDGRLLEGEYSGMAEDRLVLRGEHGPEFVPLTGVTALWEKGRATMHGGKIGAWSAGLAFAAYGGLLEMVVDYDDSFPATGIMLGGLLGAVSGGAAGAVVGSAFPRWHQRWGVHYERDVLPVPQRVGDPPPVGDDGRALGLASFGIGAIDPVGPDYERGVMVAGSLTGSLGKSFRHGVDLMLAQDVDAQPSRFASESPFFVRGSGEKVWMAGWRLEWSFARPHMSSFDPYMVVGAGAYGWVETYLGANYGLGVRWRERTGTAGAFFEIRRHDNIQNLSETDPAFVTGVVGVSGAW